MCAYLESADAKQPHMLDGIELNSQYMIRFDYLIYVSQDMLERQEEPWHPTSGLLQTYEITTPI